MSPSQILNQWKNRQKLCKMRKQRVVTVPFGHREFHETVLTLVAEGSKETSPPAARTQRGGGALLTASGHHHRNHARSISCLINFTSWFPAASPLNFHGARPEWCRTLKGCLRSRSCTLRTEAYIRVNGDNGTCGWRGITGLGNSYTCATPARTDTAKTGRCSLTPSSKSAAKKRGFGCCAKSELQDAFLLPGSADHSQEMSVFAKIPTILYQNHKLFQVISVVLSLGAEDVQVPLWRNMVPQVYEQIQKEEEECKGHKI